MKKIGFIFLLSTLTFSAFGQQFLWTTNKEDGRKYIPSNKVTKEVLKFFDHYRLYYDYAGYNRERFINEVEYGFDSWEWINEVKEPAVYAMRSNDGNGSLVMVICISEKNINMIVFSNAHNRNANVTGDREQFASWFKTLIDESGDANMLYLGSSSQENKDSAAGYAERTVDSNALYGKSGGGGGPSLNLAGWRWDYDPKPKDSSKENGRIVFEIKVDDNGKVVGVRTLEKTVSPTLEQLYRREVEKLSFSPLSGNTIPAPISTGKITFIIQSK